MTQAVTGVPEVECDLKKPTDFNVGNLHEHYFRFCALSTGHCNACTRLDGAPFVSKAFDLGSQLNLMLQWMEKPLAIEEAREILSALCSLAQTMKLERATVASCSIMICSYRVGYL